MSFRKNWRSATQARIGLGVVGHGLPTKAWLEFSLSHALATDAVYEPWNPHEEQFTLAQNGIKSDIISTLVTSREHYIMRPDLGRLLSDESRERLRDYQPPEEHEILVVVSNGLSSLAVKNYVPVFLPILLNRLHEHGLSLAYDKVFLAEHARVAIIDALGHQLKPHIALIIIGERPGLSSIESLSVYLCYRPRHGSTDADRNCISNIRVPEGLSYQQATEKIIYLITEALRRKISGVQLKDQSDIACLK